jgi:secreted trypsin-like serine protease
MKRFALAGSALLLLANAPPEETPLPVPQTDIGAPNYGLDNDGNLVESGEYAIGGEPVSRGYAPWQVQIFSGFTGYTEAERGGRPMWEMQHRCGGSLIAPNWVLTAAHCITQAQVDRDYRVRLATTNLVTSPGRSFRIDRIVRHADYDPETNLNDIALVHFKGDVGRIAPVALHGSSPSDGPLLDSARFDRRRGISRGRAYERELRREQRVEEFQAVAALGWGNTKPGREGRPSMVLIRVDLDILSEAECKKNPYYRSRVGPSTICAARDGKDTCTGDSGGPLTLFSQRSPLNGALPENRTTQIGIVSWGEGCAQEGAPGVYTRVSAYRNWIRRAMRVPPTRNELR